MIRTTEQTSNHDGLETMTTRQLLEGINQEDQTVATSVKKVFDQIERVVQAVYEQMKNHNGRLFYIGAGTSGRLGIVDASECPPTFGVPQGLVVGIIAGGDGAIRKAVEFAEDSKQQAFIDLQNHLLTPNDCVVGIAASGTTPYVVGGLEKAREMGCITACIVCNEGSPVAKAAQYPIEIVVGPEFITGSTRMKAGTAQKLVLNMISTAIMVKMGKVKGNKMIDMMPSNNKLIDRGVKMIMDELDIEEGYAKELLDEYGSVRKAMEHYKQQSD